MATWDLSLKIFYSKISKRATHTSRRISFFLDNKKKDTACPLWISEDLEFWPEPSPKFTQIAILYSELIALSANGQLYQWKWNDHEPYR